MSLSACAMLSALLLVVAKQECFHLNLMFLTVGAKRCSADSLANIQAEAEYLGPKLNIQAEAEQSGRRRTVRLKRSSRAPPSPVIVYLVKKYFEEATDFEYHN